MIDLSNGGTGPIPVQKHVFFMAKSHWEEKAREEARKNNDYGGSTGHNRSKSISWNRDS